MFVVVAKKSRTSLFPCSAGEPVCGSWEWAQPDSQTVLANGNIPDHTCHAQFINGSWLGVATLFSRNSNLSMTSVFPPRPPPGVLQNPRFLGFTIAAEGLAASQS